MKLDTEFYKRLLDNLSDGVYFVGADKRVTYWNKGAERISGFIASEVIGTRCSDNGLVHVDEEGHNLCEQGCPLMKTLGDGVVRSAELYLRHKRGHRVPVLIRTSPLFGPKGKIIGAVEMFSDNSAKIAVLQRIEELEKMAYIDPLTELANRRHTEISLRARIDELRRYGWPFGACMIDVDHLKQVNDQYGHDAGDLVLKMVAQKLTKGSRSSDILGRWGGEEFIAAVLNVNKEQLRVYAERIRHTVEQSSVSIGSAAVQTTVSVGATLALPDDTVEKLLKRADELMYRSKAGGRNRLSID
jgi:diguanylate cyclase (GGDEF)-like protein/PAS domain S-box-containing protein